MVLADAGYWHKEQMEQIVSDGIVVLIRPDGDQRKGTRRGWNRGYPAFMRRVLETELGGGLYRKRKTMIEPASPARGPSGCASCIVCLSRTVCLLRA